MNGVSLNGRWYVRISTFLMFINDDCNIANTIVKDGISAFCTTSGIQPSIVPDMSINQIMKIHFDTFPLPVSFQINANILHASHIVLLHCYLSILANTMSKHPFSQCRLIRYLENAYSDRFQTFIIGKVCFSQC